MGNRDASRTSCVTERAQRCARHVGDESKATMKVVCPSNRAEALVPSARLAERTVPGVIGHVCRSSHTEIRPHTMIYTKHTQPASGQH